MSSCHNLRYKSPCPCHCNSSRLQSALHLAALVRSRLLLSRRRRWPPLEGGRRPGRGLQREHSMEHGLYGRRRVPRRLPANHSTHCLRGLYYCYYSFIILYYVLLIMKKSMILINHGFFYFEIVLGLWSVTDLISTILKAASLHVTASTSFLLTLLLVLNSGNLSKYFNRCVNVYIINTV